MSRSITLVPRLAGAGLAAAAIAAAAPAAASAQSLAVTGEQTAVTPDAGLVSALTSLGAGVGLTGKATTDESGRFVFPVTGGRLTPELVGRITHTGGIQFTNSLGIPFGIRSFTIDTRGPQPALTALPTLFGLTLPVRVAVATIDDLEVDTSGEPVIVDSTLRLTAIGALYINVGLGTGAVQQGTVFGTATSTVTVAGS